MGLHAPWKTLVNWFRVGTATWTCSMFMRCGISPSQRSGKSSLATDATAIETAVRSLLCSSDSAATCDHTRPHQSADTGKGYRT